MKSLTTIFLLVVFSFPLQAQEGLSGYYKADPLSNSDAYLRYFIGYHYIVGSDLSLKENATFTYRTCGLIMKGHWEVEEDSLFLFVESNRWRNDSLNKYGFNGRQPKMRQKPIKYRIKPNGSLVQVIDFKEAMSIETLVKSETRSD